MPDSPATEIARGPKVSELIARRIVDEIVTRELQPGDMLPSETAMLERYKVGRSSLREALLLLEVLGLISRKPGRKGGPVVGKVSPGDFGGIATLYFRLGGITYRQLIESRLILQPISARLAAERREPSLMAQLKDLLARSEDVDLDDDHAYLALILEYQAAVTGVAGNPILTLFGQMLGDIYSTRLEGAIAPRPQRKKNLQIHMEIAEAILAGDGTLAEARARAHMEGTMRRLSKSLSGILDQVIEWV
jgi:DNA-binding FadR family transcriptional regulator